MNIFEFDNYKNCINKWISLQQSQGHGQLRRMALHLKVNSVVMSQIFRGQRDLTLEQALDLCYYIGFTEIERDYFLLLVQKARAGTEKLKKVLDQQINQLAKSAQVLKNRIQHQKLSDENKAVFYSHWYYSAIRLGVSIPSLKTNSLIADYLKLDRLLVSKVLDFLIENELIINQKNGFAMGPQITHVGNDSPFVNRHHNNWRIQGLKAMDHHKEDDFFYSGPMVLSNSLAKEIRKSLIDIVEKTTKKVGPSNSETLKCLNIDWFGVGDK